MVMKKATLEFNVSEFDGMNFIITKPGEIMQSFWIGGKYYEPEMIEFIKDNYKGGMFIDVGSCIGNHTMAFSTLADGVISFEPIPFVCFHQAANLFLSRIRNVVIYNVGLSNKNGILRANIIGPEWSNLGGGTIQKNGEIKIPVVKLDSFKFKNVKLMKIDVEGHELNVIKGGMKTIKESKPDLFIECSTEKRFKEIYDYLQSLRVGYKFYDRKVFNNTPTMLFTVRDFDKYKLREREGEKK